MSGPESSNLEPSSFERNPALYTSASEHWATPDDVYDKLNSEFQFTLDPCPLGGNGGLHMSWEGQRVYCNPPYGRGIGDWLKKATETALAVFLLPARTDTRWWHDYALRATEIRFIKGRLSFKRNDGKPSRATFPSVVLVYRNEVSL